MRFSAVGLIIVSLAAATCAPKAAPPAAQPTAAPAPIETAAVARPARAEGATVAMMAAEPASLSGSKFDPACAIPFGSIGQVRAIDNACGPEGAGSAKSQLQNAVKNNFCASGTPLNFNRQLGDRLNTAVNNLNPPLTWGSGTNIPADRSPLKDLITVAGQRIGEGSLVRTVAYFMHANYSHTSNGEKVNCDRTGQANNDIHIYLAMTQAKTTDARA